MKVKLWGAAGGRYLRGIKGLCEEVALKPEAVERALMRLADNQAGFCRATVKAGLGVAFLESAAAPPLLSPPRLREEELPALKHMLAIAAEITRHPGRCVMGGNTCPVMDDLLPTGTGFAVTNVETDRILALARPNCLMGTGFLPLEMPPENTRLIRESLSRGGWPPLLAIIEGLTGASRRTECPR